jgi:hypothetical protein
MMMLRLEAGSPTVDVTMLANVARLGASMAHHAALLFMAAHQVAHLAAIDTLKLEEKSAKVLRQRLKSSQLYHQSAPMYVCMHGTSTIATSKVFVAGETDVEVHASMERIAALAQEQRDNTNPSERALGNFCGLQATDCAAARDHLVALPNFVTHEYKVVLVDAHGRINLMRDAQHASIAAVGDVAHQLQVLHAAEKCGAATKMQVLCHTSLMHAFRAQCHQH